MKLLLKYFEKNSIYFKLLRLFGRTAKELMCLDCQVAYLRADRRYLEKVIQKYHKSDTCVLFAKYE